MEYYAKPNKTIEEHNQDLQCARELLWKLGYIKSQEENKIVHEAIEHHDLGKKNEYFQRRVLSLKKKKFNPEMEVEHNVLSIYMINPKNYSKEEYESILYAVLFHHHYSDVVVTIDERKKDIARLLEGFSSYRLPMGFKIANLHTLKNQKLLGFLMKCDYAASGNYQIEYPNDFSEEKLERWRTSHSGFSWNPLQEFCYEYRMENIIAIADTGMGKTEAALRWIGNDKAFFTLPIRTAINAIYDRVSRDILHYENLEERLSLLHSSALEYYAKNLKDHELDIFDYHHRGKHLFLPLTICTADQIFNFVLKYKGYEMKLATLSYSKIVLDEIQMYDPNLLAAIILGMKTILELGGKIGIVTATFPPIVEYLMKKEIPDFSFQKEVFTSEDKIRHHVLTYEKRMGVDEITELFLKNRALGKSNKILVVCNTIKDAQKLYEHLLEKEELKEALFMLHSRFIKEDRAKKEKEILSFGKTDYIGEGIWISTQLVEASLDIDFDYLFTELQDLSSLFQRFGRCNRKGTKSVEEANCFVYLETEEGYLKEKDSSYGFIDKVLHTLSKEALIGYHGQISEKRKMKLVEEYLSYEKLENSSFLDEFEKAIKEYKNVLNVNKNEVSDLTRLRDIQNTTIIPFPVFQEYEEEIRELEEKLQKAEIPKEEKIHLREEMLKYTVEVPTYMLRDYEKALKSGNVDFMPVSPVKISQYDKIVILESLYDEMRGFQAKKFIEKNITFEFM
ncbi:CRISPR-associated helicase/endonuclease Cas3 [Fusobacterium necrophorum subsp. funduliforme]|mgnify:FL=1|uniref:CRISPR-associated helicase/endonuclease Cas3 n=1 Tax=Fusobacterium necrophorum subsp. funduliforme TaxID=143387 RepID=A0A161QUQ8_9FUSO|nr:CRISPR-associated helicase/endonuclease Cas3 [Fusobacterium necrophorum]AYV92657.1 CRISPR-associated helicase/endonuclease Cas3 [Fusobacterium necrophorum subsp. funduliforme]KYL04552.1 CRISPR-associated helicase/endonuclease Cas3 [Fusobacterium necrophorum subsp. funduliforme]KYM44202.1 CRISPR-associated helicase/endonuclease Cas3 [Fusobacterium necrophorum subsp. funduliforme]KYM62003.1 CRISPR-associated helicase/endonuclease Cas3 [Fusobacterium necrophorum subsp. funduliforme]KYM65606.1 